jgi:pyruvate dehydrogenase E2 component (dihydrolipoamide acetyltransferase)
MAHHKSSNPNEFILPDLGEGVHEAELIKWLVQPGQRVNEHDVIAEMNTDKALVEVPSPRSGVIARLHGSPGEILKVGNVLVSYAEGEAGAGAAGSKPVAAAAGGKPTPASTHTPPTAAAATADIDEPPARTSDDGTVVGKMTGTIGGVNAEGGGVLATPAVRRLARELGVDLGRVTGTGIAGRVTEKDVRAAANGSAPAAKPVAVAAPAPAPAAPVRPSTPAPSFTPSRPVASPVAPAHSRPAAAPTQTPVSAPAASTGSVGSVGGTTRIPIRGVRRNIAQRLRESVNQAVHFTVMDEADASALDAARKKLAAATGEKLSFLPFIALATARVLARSPFNAMNATVDEKPGDAGYESAIVQHAGVHLGIATDTDAGLMVPVIRDAQSLGVVELARKIAAQADAARGRTIPRDQLMGSTFTISNVGSHAGRFATPVINYPEVAILAVGRARPGPVVRTVNGQQGLFVGNLLPLSLACDHRVVDGATAALALAEIVALIQDPEKLLEPARA